MDWHKIGVQGDMPLITENASELLKDGYHRLHNPEGAGNLAQAYEARLRELRERKSPPLPSWKEIWDSLKDAWREAGVAWEAERERRASANGRNSATPQL
jgi:hypothetical protein